MLKPQMKADPLADLLGEGFEPKQGAVMGGYEGADQFDRTLAMWSPPRDSADALVLPAKFFAEGRARDLARNDAYVAAGGEFHRDSVVGARFRLMSEPRWQMLGLSETWADEFGEEVEQLWEMYAESEECYADAQRRMTFTGMIRLAIINYVMNQEVLATVEWLRDRSRVSRTAFLLIDPDRLCTPQDQFSLAYQGKIRGGIERKENGEPVAYWIHAENPVNALLTGRYGAKRIAARKPWGRRQVIHISEPTRIDQTRGISQLATAIRETKIGRRYRDVALQNAVINATYAATIESELDTAQIFSILGNGSTTDPTQAILNYIGAYGAAIGAYTSGSKRLQIDGAKIPHLPPGTKLNMQSIGKQGSLGNEFESSILRYTAAALGVTYEELTRDLRETNYSSIKAGWNITQRTMRARKAMVADRLANQMFMLWLEEEINAGRITSMPRNAPNIYEGYNLLAYSNATWFGTGLGQIDELKETQAMHQRIDNGTSNHKIEISRLHGLDWREVMRQRAKEQKFAREIGLELPEPNQNAKNASTGNVGDGGDGTASNGETK
jgi:lambda family phage portal protein